MELRAPRANPVFRTDEKRIRTENTVMYKSQDGLRGFYPRSGATVRSILRRLPMSASGHCALARANRVFRTDEKRIRTENTVMDKQQGLGVVLSNIATLQLTRGAIQVVTYSRKFL